MTTKHRTTYTPPDYSRLDLMEQDGVPDSREPMDSMFLRLLLVGAFISALFWVPVVSLIVWAVTR